MADLCALCESAPAKWFCGVCVENLCTECDSSLHSSDAGFARHRRVVIKLETKVEERSCSVKAPPSARAPTPQPSASSLGNAARTPSVPAPMLPQAPAEETPTIESIVKGLKKLDDKEVLDLEQFVEMLNVKDIQKFDLFLNMFLCDLNQEMDEVRGILYVNGALVANDDLDLSKLRFHLHKVRGMCTTMGVKSIVEACVDWSKDYMKDPEVEMCGSRFQTVEDCVAYVLELLRNFSQRFCQSKPKK
mmetsp:Transcript_12895/g.17631  ORF Transcript_12895/g.17631 Transcript_12895/m.17631 type:complete len:247 (+) Transcript_12895:117-857(+)|eukprot:CAMPEP_0196587494 /NCGR_PEP_ID=MMETSP1081-20130531/57625_1 /TAXON_ID=36882 /ORGANISM="Pyramimonas amylifera, Strain CCMP720" /LENGTH=246 /DNA_ID=CAMNT_0041909689 /DNA_START=115 /DNA_END=855 /DNA_ORIENTATION=+